MYRLICHFQGANKGWVIISDDQTRSNTSRFLKKIIQFFCDPNIRIYHCTIAFHSVWTLRTLSCSSPICGIRTDLESTLRYKWSSCNRYWEALILILSSAVWIKGWCALAIANDCNWPCFVPTLLIPTTLTYGVLHRFVLYVASMTTTSENRTAFLIKFGWAKRRLVSFLSLLYR